MGALNKSLQLRNSKVNYKTTFHRTSSLASSSSLLKFPNKLRIIDGKKAYIWVNTTLSSIFMSLWPKCLRGSKLLFEIVTRQLFLLARKRPKRVWWLNIARQNLEIIRVILLKFLMQRVAKIIWRLVNKIGPIWLKKKCSGIGLLYINCSLRLTVFLVEICFLSATDHAPGSAPEHVFNYLYIMPSKSYNSIRITEISKCDLDIKIIK